MKGKEIRILHIAPQNFAGMPMDFVKMQKSVGYDARLITVYNSPIRYEEDIKLNFPISYSKFSMKWRTAKINTPDVENLKLKYYKNKNVFEELFFIFRDFKNSFKINEAIKKYSLFDFDVYHFDGGMDFFRDCRFAKKLKKMGKKIVTCYFGSDLRTRGIFKELDDISDLNLTVEFDHTKIYKGINYLYFPFDLDSYKLKTEFNDIPKIIHSPTNRLYKGTNKILPVIEELKKEAEFEFILAEGMERNELLELKSKCDIAIDQVGGEFGGSGYGKNSIESLAMGLPTITEFSDDYMNIIQDNPFINSSICNLKDNLLKLIKNKNHLFEYSKKGRDWVEKYHSFASVNKKLTSLYIEKGIITDG